MKASRSQPILASNGQPEAEPSAAFTPGPWVIYRVKDGSLRGKVLGIGDAEGGGVVPEIWRSGAEMEANYHLIAAAPDLLAAAQTVLAGLCERLENAPGNAVPVFAGIADLSDAIMKALGPSAQDTTEQSDQAREDQ